MSFPNASPGQVLNLTFPSDRYAVRSAARSVRAFLEHHGVAAPDLDAWELIVVEAGNNAVAHALPDAPPQPVEIAVEVDPSRVELRIVDHTPGFELPETVDLPDPMSEHGRGLFLMRTFSDQLRYLRGSDSNCLVIRRQRGARAAPSESAAARRPDPPGHLPLTTFTDELAAAYQSLSAIFRISVEFNRTAVSPASVEPWLAELLVLLDADWGVLRLARPGDDRLAAYSAAGADPGLLPPLPLGPSAPRRHAEIRAAFGRMDVGFSPREPLHPDDPLRCLGETPFGLVHPIFVNSELVGVLTVGRRRRQASLTTLQSNLLQTFADFLGIPIRNAWVQEQQLRALLVTHELDIASGIQRSLLPTRLPEPHGHRFAGHFQSANEVGGDFYDVIELSSDGLLLVIADVMGKGVPAAMFAAILRSQIRARPDLAAQPGHFLRWLNGALFRDLDRVEMFVTAQLAFLDLPRAELCVASAGHCPLLLASTDTIQRIHPEGLPLGIVPEAVFPEQRVSLDPGVRALFYTDGLVELRNPDGHPLGLAPLESWLLATARTGLGAAETRDSLIAFARDYRRHADSRDDLTFLLVAPHPERPPTPSAGSREPV